MSYATRNIDLEPAITDLRSRTLSRLPCDFSRLVYLASSRDLSSGRYSHDGLAFHFSETVASKAMAACHTEIFDRLLFCSLEELIAELRAISSPLRFSCPTSRSPWRSCRHARSLLFATNNPHSNTDHSADNFSVLGIGEVPKATA